VADAPAADAPAADAPADDAPTEEPAANAQADDDAGAADAQEEKWPEPGRKRSDEVPSQDQEEKWPEPGRKRSDEVDSQESQPSASTAADTWTPPPADHGPFHGSLSLRYRGRATDDESDHDLWTLFSLDYLDEARPWVSGHLQARLDTELDGKEDDDSIFHDLDDTWSGSFVGRLYDAYVELDLAAAGKGPGTLRIGRQDDPRLPEVLHFDGASFTSRPLGEKEVEVGAYAGIPVHWYESSAQGDATFGSFVEGRPWRGGRARLDWMHLEDELETRDESDDLLALGLWQTLARRWLLEGQYSRLEGENRDLRLRTQYLDPESETVVRLDYYQLLETQFERATELDPFSDALQEYFPFWRTGVQLSRPLAEWLVADLGFDLRRVEDDDDVGEFNRDYERYYATVTVRDLGAPDVGLAVTGDQWEGDDRDMGTLGADLSYAPEGPWTASVGTYYSLYKYDLFAQDERDDVRTWYARGTYRLSRDLAMELSYDFENDDFEQYHTVRWGATWQF
jgi:hypothetical protein